MKGQRFGKLVISAATGLAVTGSLLFAAAHDAHAAFMALLSGGTATQTIADSGLGDIAAGILTIKLAGTDFVTTSTLTQ